MRYLVLSDIHGNLEALDAVLADAGDSYEAVLCLGDLVGYGPNPNEVVDRVRKLPKVTCLVGNHDLAALDRVDRRLFNPHARQAAEWTGRQLRKDVCSFLEGLQPAEHGPGFFLAHASPRDPIWEYVETAQQGPPNFEAFREPFSLVGHTHVPRVLTEHANGVSRTEVSMPEEDEVVNLADGARRIVNPGGVGQPRNGDPRAAYGRLDSETGGFTFRRVSYPVTVTQRKMLEAGLPQILAARLAHGL